MTVRDQTVGDYVQALASTAAVPGGGSAAALAAAMGVALVSMVAKLSAKKAKAAEDREILNGLVPEFDQLAALVPARGLAVVIDRHMQLLPQSRPEIVRQFDADAHRKVGKGNEGDHVDRAHPGMLATVAAQVDPFRGNGITGHRRIDRERRLRD